MTKSTQSRTLLPRTGFLLLSLLISWCINIPLALTQQNMISRSLPGWTHYLSYLGPMLAALLVTGLESGISGLKDLGKRMLIRKICPRWWLTALLPLLLGWLITRILNRITGSTLSLEKFTILSCFTQMLILWDSLT